MQFRGQAVIPGPDNNSTAEPAILDLQRYRERIGKGLPESSQVDFDEEKTTIVARNEAPLLCWANRDSFDSLCVTAKGVTIGRGAGVSIDLSDDSVSHSHAHIFNPGGLWMLSDCGSTNGIFVEGQAITAPWLLDSELSFRIGETEFWFFPGKEANADDRETDEKTRVLGQPLSPPGAPSVLMLELQSPHHQGQRIFIEKSCTLGRGSSVTRLDAEGVSAQHARIHNVGDGRFFVQDLNSTNGTRINGRLLRARSARLCDGDTLQIGCCALQAHLVAQADGPSGKLLPPATKILRFPNRFSPQEGVASDAEIGIRARPKARRRGWVAGLAALLTCLPLFLLVPIDAEVRVDAQLLPARHATISAPTATEIQALHVDHGQRVMRGELLLELSSRRLKHELAAATAQLDRLRQQAKQQEKPFRSPRLQVAHEELRRQRVMLRYALKRLKRNRAAFHQGLASKETLDEVRQAVEASRSDYRLAKARLAQARSDTRRDRVRPQDLAAVQARIEALRNTIQRLRIKAPFSGAVSLAIGHSASTQPVLAEGEVILELTSTKKLIAVAKVPAAYAALARPGKALQLELFSAMGSVAAQIEAVAPRLESDSSGFRYLALKATVANPAMELKAGQHGELLLGKARLSVLRRLRIWWQSRQSNNESPGPTSPMPSEMTPAGPERLSCSLRQLPHLDRQRDRIRGVVATAGGINRSMRASAPAVQAPVAC